MVQIYNLFSENDYGFKKSFLFFSSARPEEKYQKKCSRNFIKLKIN